MKSPKPEKPSNNRQKREPSAGGYARRAAELAELLKACRDLSDILDPDELYAAFGGIIKNKFGISRLGLFVYESEKEIFESVFNFGLGKLSFKFKKGTKSLWEKVLQDKGFAVADGSAEPQIPKFVEKPNLDKMPSGL